MTENANALIGTRYINDDVLFEPIFIVAKKKIVVPKPNDSDDITKKFSQKIQSKLIISKSELIGVMGVTKIIATI